MSAKKNKPRLSKGILEMKFMQRTRAKVHKEMEEEEGREMYSNEITDKMLNSKSNYVMEPSIVNCEDLIEGRLSFRGMNPEIERLLELEQAERDAAKRHEQPKEISDRDMAAFYHAQQVPTVSKTMQKKFQKKQFNNKRKSNDEVGLNNGKKKMKFLKPADDEAN